MKKCFNLPENVGIYLTTRGRTDRQFTLDNLTQSMLKNITIVCYPGEKQEHLKKWGSFVKDIIEHPKHFTHLGQIRKWCIESQNKDYVILLDDNLKFNVRLKSEKQESCKFPLHQLINKHFSFETIEWVQIEMFNWIVEQLQCDTFGVVGISTRTGNQQKKDYYSINERIYGFWAVNCKLYNQLKDKETFSTFPNKNDFAICMEFLRSGIPIISSNIFAFDKQGGANAKGGCSIYRNVENSNKEALQLQEAYKPFVTIKNKSVKSWGGDFEQIAIDNICYWKKAYEFGASNQK